MKVIALIKTNLLSLVLNELKEFETKNVYPGVFKDFYPSSVLRKWYKKHGKSSNTVPIVVRRCNRKIQDSITAQGSHCEEKSTFLIVCSMLHFHHQIVQSGRG